MNKEKPTGFIKLSRKVRTHWLWKSSRKKTKFEAWVDLIFRANIEVDKESFGHDLIELKRGEILCSQEGLAKDWGWDRSAVRHFIKMLETDRMISVKVTNKFTVITLCNYATYNDKQPAENPQETNKKPADDQQHNTYKNNKNNKNNKSGKNIDAVPFESEDLNGWWQKWIEFRRQKKDALTVIGADQQIKMLSKYSPEIGIKIIEKSIEKGWKGLFDEDFKGQSNVVAMGQKIKAISVDDNEMIVYEDGKHIRPNYYDFLDYKAGKKTLSHFDRVA